MFPIHNDVGEVIAFSGRVIAAEASAAKVHQLARDSAVS